jgi:hypothetical protein
VESLYPNPVSDYIYMTVTSARNRGVDLSIYNSVGQTVFDATLDFYPPIREYSLDVSYLTHGIYYLRISQRQEVYVVKFVK